MVFDDTTRLLSIIMKALQGPDCPDSVESRFGLIERLIDNFGDTIEARYALGQLVLSHLTNWKAKDHLIRQLYEYLVVALALDNDASLKSADHALEKILPLCGSSQYGQHGDTLRSLIGLVLHFYRRTRSKPEFLALSELLKQGQGLLFLDRCEIAGLLAPVSERDRSSGHFRMDIRDLIESLYGGDLGTKVKQSEILAGTKVLVSRRSTEWWAEQLPDLVFVASDRSSFANACRLFLRSCFDSVSPALLLVRTYENSDADATLVRVEDLLAGNDLQIGPISLLSKYGHRLHEAPHPQDDLFADGFLDREASASALSRTWLLNNSRRDNVIYPDVMPWRKK